MVTHHYYYYYLYHLDYLDKTECRAYQIVLFVGFQIYDLWHRAITTCLFTNQRTPGDISEHYID